MKNNKIKIAGVIKDKPQLILDASEYERRKYETKLVAERKSGTEDVLILQFDGSAMQEEDFEKLEAGTCVIVAGISARIHAQEELQREYISQTL